MLTFQIDDMTCGHCVRSLTQAVHTVDPAAHVSADLARHQLSVAGTAARPEALAQAMAQAGYAAVSVQTQAPAAALARSGCCCARA